MQAGRELDVKVAQSLGYDVFEADGEYWVAVDDETADPLEHFSTTWEGMGVLVEEAASEGIFLSYEHVCGGYLGLAYDIRETNEPVSPIYSDDEYRGIKLAPHAVCLAFLRAKGVTTNANDALEYLAEELTDGLVYVEHVKALVLQQAEENQRLREELELSQAEMAVWKGWRDKLQARTIELYEREKKLVEALRKIYRSTRNPNKPCRGDVALIAHDTLKELGLEEVNNQ